MFFVMDTSRGITSELLSRMKNFVLQQNDIYKVSDVGARFSLISYADRGVMQLPLNRGTSIAAVRNALNSIGLTGRQRRVESGLQVVRDVIVNKRDGVQEDKGKVIVLMVGGKSDQFGLPSIKSEADELKRAGAKVVVIGIGSDLDETALKSAATKPENFIPVKSGESLLDAIPTISQSVKDANSASLNLDLGFILGSDGESAEADFALGKKAIKSLVKKLDISSEKTRIGLIVYGKKAGVVLTLDSSTNSDSFITKLDQTLAPQRGFALNDALVLSRRYLFDKRYGARDGIPKTAMIFINRDIDEQSKQAADVLRKDGVKIVAVSLGDRDVDDSLKRLTASDKDIFRIDTAKNISKLIKSPAPTLIPGLFFLLSVAISNE